MQHVNFIQEPAVVRVKYFTLSLAKCLAEKKAISVDSDGKHAGYLVLQIPWDGYGTLIDLRQAHHSVSLLQISILINL